MSCVSVWDVLETGFKKSPPLWGRRDGFVRTGWGVWGERLGVSCWGGGGKNCFGELGDFGGWGLFVRTGLDVEDHAGGRPPAWHPAIGIV